MPGLADALRNRISPYVILALSRSGTQATTFVAMLVAIRSLKADAFGAFSVAWTATVIASAVVYAGFVQYLLRARDVDAAKHTTFWLLTAEGAAFSAAMVFAGLGIRMVGNPAVATSLLVLAPVPLLTSACAWADALLTRDRRAAAVSVAQLLAEVSGAAALLGGIALGWTLAALLAWRTTSTVAAFIALMLLSRQRPKIEWSQAICRESIQTAMPLQGSMLVLSASGYAAEFLLAGHLNTAVSGAYRAASRIAITATTVFLAPMGPLTWTAMAEHERAGHVADMRHTYSQHLKLLSFFAWPTLICLARSSERLFSVLAREDWSGAAPVLTLIALARMADVLTFFMEPVLVCTGRPGLQFRLRTLTVIVFLIGVAITSPRGGVAVSQWQLVYNALYAALAVEVVCRSLDMPRRVVLRATGPALATAALCAIAGELAYRASALSAVLRLSMSIAAMAACMGLCFLVLTRLGALRLPKRY
jgi:O-antigen/teichoic acid export membrane protein